MRVVMGTRVKLISPDMSMESPTIELPVPEEEQERVGVQLISDLRCQDYDWLVVYDDLPRWGESGRYETETLACPKEHTILITEEPPTIRLYPECYTRQFEYVLTTHDRCYLPHRNWRRGQGCLLWIADYSAEEVYGKSDWPKTKLFSTVCSTKKMKHTQHFNRYRLTEYISRNIPEMDWFGWGKARIASKTTALTDYRYHLAVENYIHPYHWTDKISDPILGLCLTFYAGDPALPEIFPPECVIPIPINDPSRSSAGLFATTNMRSDFPLCARRVACSLPAITSSIRLCKLSDSTKRPIPRRSGTSLRKSMAGTGCVSILSTWLKKGFCSSSTVSFTGRIDFLLFIDFSGKRKLLEKK